MIYQVVAGIVGSAVFAVMAHTAVLHSGGYASDIAPVLIVLSLAAIAAAFISGDAWRSGKPTLSVLLMLGVLVAEYTNLQRTAEHLAATRTQQAAPVTRQLNVKRSMEKRVTELRSQLSTLSTSERLRRALDAQRKTSSTIALKASERGCASNCRKLLQSQADVAQNEVTAARDALKLRRDAIVAELRTVKSKLDALPTTRPISPLASWLALPSHWLDLSHAGGMSIAMLLLGASLLHYAGGHGLQSNVTQSGSVKRERDVTHISDVTHAVDVTLNAVDTPRLEAPDKQREIQSIDDFATSSLKPAERSKATIGDLRASYIAWCDQQNREPACERLFAAVMLKLVKHVGLNVKDGVNPVVHGIKVEIA